MNRSKKRSLILGIICLIILVGAIVADILLNKSYLNEIKYEEMVEKIENKDSFVLLFSQTTCTHCMDFKPKLAKVAKQYKIKIYYLLYLSYPFFPRNLIIGS